MRAGDTNEEYVVHEGGKIARASNAWGLGLCSKLCDSRILTKLLLIWRDSTFVLLSQIQALGGLMEAFEGLFGSALDSW